MDDPLAELNAEERKALAELAKARADGDISRRDLMTLGGAGVVGALLGGGGMTAATGSAAAATTQSGTIGTDTDRVDVFGEDVDASASITDAAGVEHTSELADDGDPQPPEDHDNAAHSTVMIEDATTTGNAPYEVQKNGTDGTGIINFKT